MPQLISGRHTVINADFTDDAITIGNDMPGNTLFLALRLKISNAATLRDYLFLVLHRPDDALPTMAAAYAPEFSVVNVLNYETDFAEVEIAEFREWLEKLPV